MTAAHIVCLEFFYLGPQQICFPKSPHRRIVPKHLISGNPDIGLAISKIQALVLFWTLCALSGTVAQAVCVGASVNSSGAKGDGHTDDTAAIQNAINAASSAGGGSLRILLFWTPVIAISILGLGIFSLFTFLWLHVRRG